MIFSRALVKTIHIAKLADEWVSSSSKFLIFFSRAGHPVLHPTGSQWLQPWRLLSPGTVPSSAVSAQRCRARGCADTSLPPHTEKGWVTAGSFLRLFFSGNWEFPGNYKFFKIQNCLTECLVTSDFERNKVVFVHYVLLLNTLNILCMHIWTTMYLRQSA